MHMRSWSFLPVLVAITLIGFRSNTIWRSGCNDSNLKWFILPNGSGILVSAVSSAYLVAPFVPDLNNDGNSNGDFNLSTIKATGSAYTVLSQIGCDQMPVYVCAIAFNNSQLNRYQVPGTSDYIWAAPSTIPECYLVRATP